MSTQSLHDCDDASDRAALERLRAGDTQAFSLIVRRYASVLYSLCYRMLGADPERAQEAVQEIFLKVHRSLPGFNPDKRFFPWMYTIALNHLRSMKRSTRARGPARIVPLKEAREAEAMDPAPRPDEVAIAQEGERLAQRALESLPPRLREVFLLRHVEGLSAEDVAQILGVPPATVRTWLFRARQRMKEKLLDAGWE